MSETKGKIDQVGDYHLTKKLGEGGMGTVFKAHQVSMDRDVALKVLPKHLAKNPGFVERFYREARASAKLDHPNIVRGIDVGEDKGFHYFAMEFIDGESVDKHLERSGKLSVGDAVKIGIDVAHALEHAHSKGMVHRDIKPDNIMVTRSGQIKLADLGLAKATDDDSGLTQTGSGFGTPYYMPPEQALNAKYVYNRSDIYALGATLYHLVTGKVPYDGETAVEVLTAKKEGRHSPARRLNADVPEILDLVIDKMMHKDPKTRYQNAADVIAALEKTDCASAKLSWIGHAGRSAPAAGSHGHAAAGTHGHAAAVGGGPKHAAPATHDSGETETVQYYLKYKDRTGKLMKTTADKHKVRDMIRKGLLGTDVEGSKDANGPFRPLMAFAEFGDLMKSRLLKEKGDAAAGGGMGERFAEIDKQESHRRGMRKLQGTVGNLVTWIVALAMLFGGAWFAWNEYSKAQSAPKPATANDPNTPAAGQNAPPPK